MSLTCNDLCDILSRLVETVAEQGEDMQVGLPGSLHPRYYASLVLAMVRCLSVSVLVTDLCFIEMCEQFELVFDLHTNLSIFFRHTLTVLLPYLIKLVTWEEYPV